MKIFADHYFQIGATHYSAGKPCQDYALSASSGMAAYALVSDGCSTGRHTDMGARVTVFSMLQAIREVPEHLSSVEAAQAIALRAMELSRDARILLGLGSGDMLATSAVACLRASGGFVHLQGDGVIAKKKRNGEISAEHYSWKDNTPFYPAYRSGRLEDFLDAHGGDAEVVRAEIASSVMSPQGTWSEEVISGIPMRDGILGFTRLIHPEEMEELEYVAVFTDGVTQIDEVEWKDAVKAFLSFKSLEGEFAKRRMIRGVKDMQKIARGPQDDIAYAVIRVAREENHAEDESEPGSPA